MPSSTLGLGTRRVSYNGYYASLPRTRNGFDSRYPLQRKNGIHMAFFLWHKKKSGGATSATGKNALIRAKLDILTRSSESNSPRVRRTQPSQTRPEKIYILKKRPLGVFFSTLFNVIYYYDRGTLEQSLAKACKIFFSNPDIFQSRSMR